MQTVGERRRPAHAHVRESAAEYVVELDVAGFAETELSVELDARTLVVRGDQFETAADRGAPLRLHERLEETFRLPDDATTDRIAVLFTRGALEIHVPRSKPDPRTLRIEHRAIRGNPDAAAC